MCSKAYTLNGEEKLKVLRSRDEVEPLSAEQIEDIEGPADNDPLIVTEFLKTKDVARKNGVEILGDRKILSGGSFGQIFKLEARDLESGKDISLIERTFTEIKDIEKRFCSVDIDTPWQKDSEPRYKIENNKDKHKDRLIIDYLYNEAQALKDLQGIDGIPRFYGAVYDDLNGSILEEYIDGPDLSAMTVKEKHKRAGWDIVAIIEKLKKVYTQAAERGYIHNDPSRSTVMIDQKQQPYLADWYLYSKGNIEADGPIKDKYLQGLQELEELEKSVQSWLSVA